MRRRAIPILLVALVALGAACDDGDSSGGRATETPTPQVTGPTTTPDAGATQAARTAVREYDFDSDSDLNGFLQSLGAVEINIGYGDVTQDGVEDAVIVVSSGGTAGDIAALVYRWTGEGVEEVLRLLPVESSFLVEVRPGGTVVSIDPVYEEGDPLCRPSAELHTAYEWDGEAFVLVDQRTEQVNP